MTRLTTRSARLGAAAAALAAAGALAFFLPGPAGGQGGSPAIDLGSDEQRAAGAIVYTKYCAQCHGDDGAGQGIAAPYLRPEPRDFTSGKYKIRSTPTGFLPTDADIRRSIVEGLPGTGMPGFADLSDTEITNVIYHLKSLAPDFADPQAYGETLPIPSPPAFSADSLEIGRQTYEEIGCARCHGALGRGDGPSAPTLRDDWGQFIAAADLTMPWTFRGGGSREDIYRSISTGLSGSPMAGFADGLTEEQRWQIVDWIVAQARDSAGDPEADPGVAPYDTLVLAVASDGDLDAIAPGGDLAAARELFAAAPKALFPVAGQIMQPGRSFRPGTQAIGVQAIYGRNDIAFMLTWNNLSAETGGTNAPDLQVPDGQRAVDFDGGAATAADDAETAGDAAEPAAAGTDVWGEDLAATSAPATPAASTATDPFAQDVFGTADTGAAATAGRPPGSDEFSDAIALQLPIELREGVAKPYFLFGDSQYPVEIWFADLGDPGQAKLYEGRGGGAIAPSEAAPPEMLAGWSEGEWTVVFKRPRNPSRGVRFAEESFVPVAFSVWDGFFRERGPKHGLTRWFHVYVEPAAAPPVIGPMAKAGLTVLGIELLIIALVRRRYGRRKATLT